MDRRFVARVAAPIALLLAATILVLLVRSALQEPEREPAQTSNNVLLATTEVETESRTEPAPTARFYVVKRGDTLEAIAAAHDTSVERLLELNPDVDPIALTIGQRLRVG